MTMSKMQLLIMCRNFFLVTVFFTIFSIWGFFYAYSIYKIFGLIITAFAALGILPYFYKNTYIILADISKMDTDSFEGKIEQIDYFKFRDILPCGIFISNKKNEREKSGIYNLNVKIPARVGSWVKICYLKKSRIIINFEVIEREIEDSSQVPDIFLRQDNVQILGEKMQRNIIKLPISELIAGIVVTLFFSAILLMMVLFPNDTADFWTFLGFSLFMTMGIVLILSWLIWRVEYDDKVFVYRSKLGHKTTVPYSSINKVKFTQNVLHLYSNSRRYTFYKNSKGEVGFLEVLSVQLQGDVEIIDHLLR